MLKFNVQRLIGLVANKLLVRMPCQITHACVLFMVPHCHYLIRDEVLRVIEDFSRA